MRIRFNWQEKILQDNQHILLLAITGGCKTNTMEQFATSFYQRQKIIFFTFKSEACQLAFPEDDPKLLNIMRRFDMQPHGYKQEVLMPFCKSQFDKRKYYKQQVWLPHSKDGMCTFKPFKLPMETIAAADFVSLLRRATETGADILGFVMNSQKYQDIGGLLKTLIRLNASTFDEEAQSLTIQAAGDTASATVGRRETYLSLIGLVASLQRSGLVCSRHNKHALDLEKVMKDKSTITTFDFAGINFQLGFLALVAILRTIISLRVGGKIRTPLLLCIPELHWLAPSSRIISPMAIQGFSSLPLMQYLSSQGRILDIRLLCDTQNPATIAYPVLQNFHWLVLSTMHRKGAAYIDENLVRLPKDVMASLPQMKKGLFSIVKVGTQRYWHPCHVCPSEARHRRPGENVLKYIKAQINVEMMLYVDELGHGLKVAIKKRAETIPETQKTKIALKLLGRSTIKGRVATEIRGQWKTKKQIARVLALNIIQVKSALDQLGFEVRKVGRGVEKEYKLVE